MVTEDTMLCEIHTTCLPWASLSFRNHRMLAAGLLPEVVHVSVIMSPSMAGLVNPVISGRPGTPVLHGNVIRNSILNNELRNNPVGQVLLIDRHSLTDMIKFIIYCAFFQKLFLYP